MASYDFNEKGKTYETLVSGNVFSDYNVLLEPMKHQFEEMSKVIKSELKNSKKDKLVFFLKINNCLEKYKVILLYVSRIMEQHDRFLKQASEVFKNSDYLLISMRCPELIADFESLLFHTWSTLDMLTDTVAVTFGSKGKNRNYFRGLDSFLKSFRVFTSSLQRPFS